MDTSKLIANKEKAIRAFVEYKDAIQEHKEAVDSLIVSLRGESDLNVLTKRVTRFVETVDGLSKIVDDMEFLDGEETTQQ